jgi:hypothetical protein
VGGAGVSHHATAQRHNRRPTAENEPVTCSCHEGCVQDDARGLRLAPGQRSANRHDTRTDLNRAEVKANGGARGKHGERIGKQGHITAEDAGGTPASIRHQHGATRECRVIDASESHGEPRSWFRGVDCGAVRLESSHSNGSIVWHDANDIVPTERATPDGPGHNGTRAADGEHAIDGHPKDVVIAPG